MVVASEIMTPSLTSTAKPLDVTNHREQYLRLESESPCISRQSSVSSRLPAVPPPAAAGGPILKTDSKTKPDQTSSLTKCSPSRQRGVGSPRGVGYKGTLVTFTIVTAVTLAYATCGRDIEVRLVINVPTNNFLDAVKVFFKEEHHNYLDTSNWLRRNHSSIKIYDLKEVLLLNQYGSPCLPRDLCPGANEQRLAGCDSAVGSCVCERGYRLEDGLCIDVDECKLHPNVCPFPATCHNQKGRFWCNCGPGYFFDRHTCKPCSHDCPMGFYEVQSCTVESDRSCKRCSECEGPFYESRSCSGTHDTDCIHAAHPVSISEEETTIEFLEGLKVESSTNVFMENLRNTVKLDEAHYITSTKQSTDFIWYRKSKIRINIGISDVSMIPIYEDVTYSGDNHFMLRNPNPVDPSMKLKEITEKHCRHPIPDYYRVTLEIARDRTTLASEVTCDGSDTCPEGYEEGDKFIKRTLNKDCVKHGTYPDDLRPAANSILCTDETELLRGLFNQDPTPVHPLYFSSRECKNWIQDCKRCTQQTRCDIKDVIAQKCCQRDCYTQKNCQLASSPRCQNAKLECAMGDAYAYTLEPVFNSTHHQFQCHIKRQKPEILYKLWFYITVTGTSFETSRYHYVVRREDVDDPNYGYHDIEFMTIKHTTGLEAHDDLILLGRMQADNPSMYNYTVHSLKKPREYTNRHPTVNPITSNRNYGVDVQFDKPFAYSSATWNKTDGCRKNLSVFKSVQKHYRDDPQPVEVITETIRNPYIYYLKSLKSPENRPHMKFIIPANISVLSWYFKDKDQELIIDKSLQAELTLSSDKTIWTIFIRGKMSACPSYMTITISDRTEQEELFQYDVLVTDSVDFNLTFKVANRGLKQDKTFDIMFVDVKKSHRMFLTQLLYETKPEVHNRLSIVLESPHDTTILLKGVLALVVLLTITSIVVYVFLEATQRRLPVHASNNRPKQGCCAAMRSLSRKQSAFIFFYIMFRIIYSFLFTFTIFFSMIFFCLHSDLVEVAELEKLQMRQNNISEVYASKMDQSVQKEVQRQMEVVIKMQGACSFYLEELLHATFYEIQNITQGLRYSDVPNAQTLSDLVLQRYNAMLEDYTSQVKNFTTKYKERYSKMTKPALDEYQRFTSQIYNDDWLLFPNSLFNQSHKVRQRLNMKGKEQAIKREFSDFIELHETQFVHSADKQFWERYTVQLPIVHQLTTPRKHKLGCDNSHLIANKFNEVEQKISVMKQDSFHYRTMDLLEFRTIWQEDDDLDINTSDYPRTFSVAEFITNLDLEAVRYTLLLLDILLLFYRFTHILLSVNTLCMGFKRRILISAEEFCKTKEMVPLVGHQGDNMILHSDDVRFNTTQVNVRGGQGQQIRIPTAAKFVHYKVNGNALPVSGGADPSASGGPHSTGQIPIIFCMCNHLLEKFIRTDFVPKVVIFSVLCLLIYIILSVAYSLQTSDLFLEVGAFLPYASSLEFQYNRTNEFLLETSSFYGASMIDWCKRYTDNQFRQLLNLVLYFNEDQKRWASSYIAEACVLRRGILDEDVCGLNDTAPQLDIPIVPCNFVPVQPNYYSGYKHDIYHQEVLEDFIPVLTALHRVLVVFSYGMLLCSVSILILRLAGNSLFQFLRTRLIFPTRSIYIVMGGALGWVSQAGAAAAATDDSDAEGDTAPDTDALSTVSSTRSNRTAKYGLHVQFSTDKTISSGCPKTKTLLSDFKYSETKV